MGRGREVECTQTCRSRQHGAQITAAIIRGTEAQAIAYLKSLCQRCCYVADATGKTALHTAASCGKRKIVKWLLSRGAQLNQRDLESGYTPLHRALFYGHLHVACTLIHAGCSVSALDHDSLTPLDHMLFDRPPIVSFTGSLPTHVYVWGSNTNYNLGQSSQQARGTPECLEAVHREGQGITDVALSKFHTVFVSSNGRVYTCGHGHGGRLGLDTNGPVITPRSIKAFTHTNIVKASVGPDHSLFLTDTGQVFSCGSNFHHQLGLNPPPEHVYTPRLLTWHRSHKDVFAGIGAAKYHSVMWTPRILYTFGLNAGQLGFFKNANERTVITPRNVTSIVLKEDGNLACVGVSDGATVLSTSHGDVYVLHQYQIRKVTSKMLGIVKIACIGGCLDSKVGASGLKEHGGDDLTIAVMTGGGAGHLYIWTQQSSHLSRCLFSINRKICVVDFSLSRHCFFIVTDNGEAFSGVMIPNRERKIRDKTSIKKSFGPSSQLIEFLDYSSCVTMRLTRLPALHRTVSIMCDPKGHNFAALQNDPSSFLLDLPEIIPSTWKADFKSFLEEANEMDTIHDVVIVCGAEKFPAHSYILASHSGYFHYHLTESSKLKSDEMNAQKTWTINMQNGKKCFVFPDVQPDLFKEVLLYMYTGSCPLLTLQVSTKSDSLNGVFDINSNNAHNACEEIPSNATHQRLPFSNYKENMRVQTPTKSRKKKGRKESEMKSGGSNPFHSVKLLAKKLQVTSLVRELKKKMYELLEESDFVNEKEEKMLLDEEPYSREKYKELWDVKIHSKGGDVLGAHKCILAARLEYFRCMFSAGWLEASSSQTLSMPLPTSILRVVLDYLYQDTSPFLQQSRDPEFVCNVLVVADQFLITRLREKCEEILSGLMTLKNAVELLEFASRCNASKLKSSSIQFMCLNLPALLENGSLLSISNNELLKEISNYYKGFVHRMACRVLTPFDCSPYAKELEQLLEENPVTLPDSDEDWEDNSPVKGEETTNDGGYLGSGRKKKRQHRNSQGDGRCRKASTSSSVSVNSAEFDPCKDLDDDFQTLTFHDLREREPTQSSAGTTEVQANTAGANVIPLNTEEYCGDTTGVSACNGWKKVNRKRSTSGSISVQVSPEKEMIESHNTPPLPQVTPGTPDSSSRSVTTTVPQFPTLQDAITSTQKTSYVTKSSKISKLSQKQRKKLAAEAQAADTHKAEQPEISTPTSPWEHSTPAWGKVTNSTTAHKVNSGPESLADIMKAEEKKIVKSPPVTIPKAKRNVVQLNNLNNNNNDKHQESGGKRWSTGKSNGAWSAVATSPPTSPLGVSLPSPSPTHLKKPVLDSPCSTPVMPSFSDILLEEETMSDNLMKERFKPLSLIQMEDRAIEELLAFYGAAECFEEKITVSRVRKAILNPTWSK